MRRRRPGPNALAPTRGASIRALAVAALAVAFVACSESHPLARDTGIADAAAFDAMQDAGSVDAAPLDAAPLDTAPDTHSCRDDDGDGYFDGSCGGNDCDDSDPELSPVAEHCFQPTSVVRCAPGVTFFACPPETPDCDARTGHCTADACGDGVVHPDEDCEPDVPGPGFGCLPDCRVPCLVTSDCDVLGPEHACFPTSSGGVMSGVCVDRIAGGAPLGGSCGVDTDCESAYCDAGQARCSEACWSTDDCPTADGAWCASRSYPRDDRPTACDFGCRRTAACPSGRICQVVNVDEGVGGLHGGATCQSTSYTGLLGAPCAEGCATGACDADDHCTVTCAADADCPPEVPVCTQLEPADFYVGISVCVAP